MWPEEMCAIALPTEGAFITCTIIFGVYLQGLHVLSQKLISFATFATDVNKQSYRAVTNSRWHAYIVKQLHALI